MSDSLDEIECTCGLRLVVDLDGPKDQVLRCEVCGAVTDVSISPRLPTSQADRKAAYDWVLEQKLSIKDAFKGSLN